MPQSLGSAPFFLNEAPQTRGFTPVSCSRTSCCSGLSGLETQLHPHLPTRLVTYQPFLPRSWSHPASFLHCWCCLFTGQEESLKGAVDRTGSKRVEQIFSVLTGIHPQFTGVSLQQDVLFYDLPWVSSSFIRFPGGRGGGGLCKG